MSAPGPARVAVTVWARLLAGIRCLAFWPAAWRRHGGLPFRAVAVGVAVALCAAALAAAPAGPASAAPTDPVDPGGDFTVSVPYSGISQTTMQTVVTNAATSLRLSPTASVSDQIGALYQLEQQEAPSGTVTWPAPPASTYNERYLKLSHFSLLRA